MKEKKTFITFQAKEVLEELQINQVYYPTKSDFKKVFALSLDETFALRKIMCAPHMPQVAIVFQTDSYEEVCSIDWCNKVFLGLDTNLNSPYKEYLIDSIDIKDVIETKIVSESDDPDEVQDDFLNWNIRKYTKLSGYRWKRFEQMQEEVSSYERNKLLLQVTLCMMPVRELTVEDYDTWASLIISLFRID